MINITESSSKLDSASSVTLQCEDNSFVFTSRSTLNSNAVRIQQFYEQSLFCDIVIIVGQLRIAAHKVCLAAASEYFRALFDFDKSNSGKNEYELKDISPSIAKAIVDYCYYGGIKINQSSIDELFNVADRMCFQELVEDCAVFMENHLEPSNCLGVRSFALAHGCQKLYEKAEQYCFRNFEKVIMEEEFFSLSEGEIFKWLSSEKVVAKESTIFAALMKWVERDVENRKQHLFHLFSVVRFPLLSPVFIAENMETHPLIKDDDRFKDYMAKVYDYHSPLPSKRSTVLDLCHRSRKCKVGSIYAFTDYDDGCPLVSVECYDVGLDKWKTTSSVCFPIHDIRVIRLDSKNYLIYGFGAYTTYLFVWNIEDETLMLITDENRFGSIRNWVVLDHIIYSFDNKEPGSREIYKGFVWMNKVNMNLERTSYGTLTLLGRVYAIGGKSNDQILKSVECYDPAANAWTFCADMNYYRSDVGVAVLNNCIYAVGGFGRRDEDHHDYILDSVERYDPDTNSWTLVASLLTARNFVGVCSSDYYLFAVGGCVKDGECTDQVECYDDVLDLWTKLQPMPEARKVYKNTFMVMEQ